MTEYKPQSAAVKKERAKHQTMIDPDLPSLTIQSEASAANINTIMAKYRQTGQIDHMKENPGQYINAASAPDFQNAMDTVATASSMFEELPSELRNKFDNDPHKMLEFVHNPDNLPEMYKLGLAIEPTPELTQDQLDTQAAATVKNEAAAAASTTSTEGGETA